MYLMPLIYMSSTIETRHKKCYMRHHRFLDPNHPYRFDPDSFDGKVEDRPVPRPLSGEEVLLQIENMHALHGQVCQHKKKAKIRKGSLLSFGKGGLFFRLPYWKDLMLRHNLDVMHIENNVCDNIVFLPTDTWSSGPKQWVEGM
jgi:hypothetical protein